jgi:hypothetical protein
MIRKRSAGFSAVRRMGGAKRYPSIASHGDDGFRRLNPSYVLRSRPTSASSLVSIAETPRPAGATLLTYRETAVARTLTMQELLAAEAGRLMSV